tara:strand:+ start:1326 stop:1565 length:240 start_codon:yes stop_codon:yes gene_type:complete
MSNDLKALDNFFDKLTQNAEKVNPLDGMNGLEVLHHILFVEWDKGLWGIIGFGIVIAIVSLWYDKYNESPEIPVNREWH